MLYQASQEIRQYFILQSNLTFSNFESYQLLKICSNEANCKKKTKKKTELLLFQRNSAGDFTAAR